MKNRGSCTNGTCEESHTVGAHLCHVLVTWCSLLSSRGIYVLMPMIMMPLLFSRLGTSSYGELVVVMSWGRMVSALVRYPLGYYAAYEVKRCQRCLHLNATYSSTVIASKCVLGALKCLVVCGITFATGKSTYPLIYTIAIAIDSLFPLWFFQGMDRTPWSALWNLVCKVLFLMFVIGFVRGDQGIAWYVWISLGVSVVRTFGGYGFVYYWGLRLVRPSGPLLKEQLWRGKHFLSVTALIQAAGRMPYLVIAHSLGPEAVSIYAVGVRYTRSLTGLVPSITQACFPLVGLLLKNRSSCNQGVHLVTYLLILSMAGMMISLFLPFFYPGQVVAWLGLAHPLSQRILFLSLPAPLFITVSNVLGVVFLLHTEKEHFYTKVTLLSVVLYGLLLGAWVITPWGALQGVLGVAYAWVCIEGVACLGVMLCAYEAMSNMTLSSPFRGRIS